MSEVARAVIAGLCASVAFVAVFHAVVHPPLFAHSRPVASLVLALGTYLGVFLALPRRSSLADRLRLSLQDAEVTPEEAARALMAARDRIEALRRAAAALRAERASRVLALADTADRILERVEADPGDLRRVGRFLRRDLAAAADIAERYAMIDAAALEHGRSEELRRKFDAALNDLERVFEKHHARTYDDELFELEARLELLESQGRRA
jgi:5-bromo-4-chloroindolyl phosphate hydrolysis protein